MNPDWVNYSESFHPVSAGDNVEIPLHPFVDVILKKYNYNLPSISNQKFNTYIKEVSKVAKLKREVVIRQTRGN